ncbi:hypothetical protein RRG08_024496 [Elysia crispata]|uniref:Uncharacterized protein n=1 Tax=Elysia crispata TaxID=231223 RepID=A0AAE0YQY3_9GAST|nr:hypothetical protein RRG08_024496 [Elysia crispata]
MPARRRQWDSRAHQPKQTTQRDMESGDQRKQLTARVTQHLPCVQTSGTRSCCSSCCYLQSRTGSCCVSASFRANQVASRGETEGGRGEWSDAGLRRRERQSESRRRARRMKRATESTKEKNKTSQIQQTVNKTKKLEISVQHPGILAHTVTQSVLNPTSPSQRQSERPVDLPPTPNKGPTLTGMHVLSVSAK